MNKLIFCVVLIFIFYITVTATMLKIVSYFRKEKEKFSVLLLTSTVSTLALIVITLAISKIIQPSLSILKVLILFMLPFSVLISYKFIGRKTWSHALTTVFWVIVFQGSIIFVSRLGSIFHIPLI